MHTRLDIDLPNGIYLLHAPKVRARQQLVHGGPLSAAIPGYDNNGREFRFHINPTDPSDCYYYWPDRTGLPFIAMQAARISLRLAAECRRHGQLVDAAGFVRNARGLRKVAQK